MSREKRKSWRRPKKGGRRAPTSATSDEKPETTYNYGVHSVGKLEHCAMPTTEDGVHIKLIGSLREMARLVWEPDYTLLFDLEQRALEEAHGLMSAGKVLKELPDPSTYKHRGEVKKTEAEQQARDRLNAQAFAVQAMRQANQCRHAFSSCVYSLEALGKRLPRSTWRRRTRQKELLDYKTACKFLKMVMQVSCSRFHACH